jgi:hypothetical protein
MICENCVYLPSLKKFVSNNGVMENCDFCESHSVCIEDNKLSDFMLEKTDNVLVPTDCLSHYEQAMVFDCGSDEPPIFELWEFFEKISAWAVEGFMETFFENIPKETDTSGRSILYALDDGYLDDLNDFENGWEKFLLSINNKNRFFNQQATTFLNDLFAVLIVYSKLDSSIVHILDNEKSIYRARIASSKSTLKEIQLDPVKQLGPTPAHLASNQRMSPEGISVFYGALDRATCISEIRPLVGDTVISGEFRPLNQLRLLDLNGLANYKPNTDVFDENYVQHAHATAFFKELVFQMSRPARRGVSNAYLSTQVIFEYLSVKFSDQVDGIMYRSVQQDQAGECIALFSCASGVSNTASNEFPATGKFQRKDMDRLFFVLDSMRYHRVRGVAYKQQEFEDDYVFTANDRMLKLTNFHDGRF